MIKNFVKRVLREGNSSFFDEIELILSDYRSQSDSLESFVQYILKDDRFLQLGSGAFRTVFQYKSEVDCIVKVGRSTQALKQNLFEIKFGLDPKMSKIFPKTFNYDKEGFWFVQEAAVVVDDPSSLSKYLSFPPLGSVGKEYSIMDFRLILETIGYTSFHKMDVSKYIASVPSKKNNRILKVILEKYGLSSDDLNINDLIKVIDDQLTGILSNHHIVYFANMLYDLDVEFSEINISNIGFSKIDNRLLMIDNSIF